MTISGDPTTNSSMDFGTSGAILEGPLAEAAWQLAELAPVPAAMIGTGGAEWRVNAAGRALLGLAGRGLCGLFRALEAGEAAALARLLRQAAAGGTGGRLVLHPATAPGAPELIVQAELAAFRLSGNLAGWLLTFTDVTEVAGLSSRLQLELDELKHRLRNLFTLVLGLVRLSGRGGPGGEEDLARRLKALAAAHTADENPDGMAVDQLVRQVLQPYTVASRVTLKQSGPPLALPQRMASALALAVNELATNALKHGALAGPDGRLTVEITTGTDGFTLSWLETGVGSVPGAGSGFGSKLLAMTVEQQLGGQLKRHWLGSTLRIEIAVPRAAEAGAPGQLRR